MISLGAYMPSSGWAGRVGIPGGIPVHYTKFCDCTVSIPGYSGALAVGDGITDDTAAIQAAINLCPDFSYVDPGIGTFLVTSLSRTGVQYYDSVSRPFSIAIRGHGPALTHIISANSGGSIISFVNNGGQGGGTFTADRARGDTTFTYSSNVGYYGVGTYIQIKRDNSTSGAVNPAGYMGVTCSQIVKVTGIAGSTVTFTPALNDPVYASTDTFAVSASGPFRCGIEDLSIERTTSAGIHNIFWQGAYECWVKNVESIKPLYWHVRWEYSANCEMRDCLVHDTWDGGGGSGYGCGYFTYSCNNLCENNRFHHIRHAMITEYGGQGNVFGYNYSYLPLNENGYTTNYLMGDMITHGGSPRYNLWEGNVAATIRLDDVLGAADHNLFFRNWVQRKGFPGVTLYATFGSDIQEGTRNIALIGNVYEVEINAAALRRWGSSGDNTSSPDTAVEPSCLLHGEYDDTAVSTQWANVDHTLDDSMYLTVKPSFWESTGQPWPANGVDLAVKFGGNPAQRRSSGGAGFNVSCTTLVVGTIVFS